MFLRGFFILIMLLSLSGAYAMDATENRDKVIDDLMEISGLNHQIEQLPAMINAGMRLAMPCCRHLAKYVRGICAALIASDVTAVRNSC